MSIYMNVALDLTNYRTKKDDSFLYNRLSKFKYFYIKDFKSNALYLILFLIGSVE